MAATQVPPLPNYFTSSDADLSDHPKLATFDQDACKVVKGLALGPTSSSYTSALYQAATDPIFAEVPHQCLSGNIGANLRSKTGPNVAQYFEAANFFAPCFCTTI